MTTANPRHEARYRARLQTHKHIERVRGLLAVFEDELHRRGREHDKSKYTEVELEPLAEMLETIEREGNAPYGSEEYKRRAAKLKPMLEHHYAHNSHHAEHYPNGVDGMDLFDVVEMFVDWKAASERGEESAMNLTHAADEKGLSLQLFAIFRNTADRLGWKHV